MQTNLIWKCMAIYRGADDKQFPRKTPAYQQWQNEIESVFRALFMSVRPIYYANNSTS